MNIRTLSSNFIDQAIELSLNIFKPKDGRANDHHDPLIWKKYFDEGGLLVGAFVNGQLAGFAFGYKVNDKDYHSWMVGVAEKYRGLGIGRKLLEKQEELARKKGYKILSVNTYQEKFPVMYSLLQSFGYRIYKEKEKTWDGKPVVKSYFRKKFNQEPDSDPVQIP